jgi:hypothetical protein
MSPRLITAFTFLLGTVVARADTTAPAVPAGFVCSISGGYHLTRNGTVESSQAKLAGGTITVDTRSGIVAGDAISSNMWSWRVVQAVDAHSALKLFGTSNSDIAQLSVITNQPSERDGTKWYPFIYLDGGLGNILSGMCRGAHD